MKPVTRVTLLLLLFLFASTAAFADGMQIGALDVLPDIPGAIDEIDVSNSTSGPALTFTDLTLVIYTGPNAGTYTLPAITGVGTDVLGDFATYFVDGTISSFLLTGDVLNGAQLVGYIDLFYNGPALATANCGGDCDFAIDLVAVPEPATLTLYGSGLCLVAWLRRRRSLKA